MIEEMLASNKEMVCTRGCVVVFLSPSDSIFLSVGHLRDVNSSLPEISDSCVVIDVEMSNPVTSDWERE